MTTITRKSLTFVLALSATVLTAGVVVAAQPAPQAQTASLKAQVAGPDARG